MFYMDLNRSRNFYDNQYNNEQERNFCNKITLSWLLLPLEEEI